MFKKLKLGFLNALFTYYNRVANKHLYDAGRYCEESNKSMNRAQKYIRKQNIIIQLIETEESN